MPPRALHNKRCAVVVAVATVWTGAKLDSRRQANSALSANNTRSNFAPLLTSKSSICAGLTPDGCDSSQSRTRSNWFDTATWRTWRKPSSSSFATSAFWRSCTTLCWPLKWSGPMPPAPPSRGVCDESTGRRPASGATIVVVALYSDKLRLSVATRVVLGGVAFCFRRLAAMSPPSGGRVR